MAPEILPQQWNLFQRREGHKESSSTGNFKFAHLFNRYLLSAHQVLGAGYVAVTKSSIMEVISGVCVLGAGRGEGQ